MLTKLVGIILVAIGAAGLVLPVIPGMLLIMVGALLFFKDKEYEIIRLINEKAPPYFSAFYHNFLSRLVNGGRHVGVNWAWVTEQMKKSEKIGGGYSDREITIRKNLNESIIKAKSLSRPNYVHAVKKITAFGSDFIEIEGNVKLSMGRIVHSLRGATDIVIFLVTVADRIEAEAGELTAGREPLRGYLLDRAGSFAVESLAESVENRIRGDYSKIKKSVSGRYSPGYCDWPIEEQMVLSKVLDFSKIGVSLNENCMMKPKKSISAIVAIADKGVFKNAQSSCEICEMPDCSYRRD